MFKLAMSAAFLVAVLAMSSVAAVSAPMNGSLVCCKAARSLNPVIPARCICSRRGFHGRCYAWSCR